MDGIDVTIHFVGKIIMYCTLDNLWRPWISVEHVMATQKKYTKSPFMVGFGYFARETMIVLFLQSQLLSRALHRFQSIQISIVFMFV